MTDRFAFNHHPPFNITRTSHVVLTSRDLGATRAFYCDVLGFEMTDMTDDALYLRGLEERSHHSIVFHRTREAPACERIGLRVFSDEDVKAAAGYFEKQGLPVRFANAPYQGLTLHVDDPVGTPLELCATMDDSTSSVQRYDRYRGGSPMRLDHFQIVTYDVQQATDFYLGLGFRLTEYTATDGQEDLWGAWLQRKGNPQDVVFANGKGPRLHHFGVAVEEVHDVIRAADVAGALGFAKHLERGPGRHGIGNAMFVYFRDPDGHRVELFTGHYHAHDINHPPRRWDLSDTRRAQLWGMPATAKWFFEASEFTGKAQRPPTLSADPVTLETFLANQY